MEFNEIRKDYFSNRYVIISKVRKNRPRQFDESEKQNNEEIKHCPFCPQNSHMTIDVLKWPLSSTTWQFKVVENKFPILSEAKSNYISDYFYPGVGKHYVIIETPEHFQRFHEMSIEQIAEFFKVVGISSDEMESQKDIEYVHYFKNEGKQSGASLKHSHSQIIAFPFVPPRIHEILDSSLNYPGCYLERIIDSEKGSKRFVIETQYFFVFTPYASIFPYELWIVPKSHVKKLSHLSLNERENLGYLLKMFITKLYTLTDSYNLILYQAPKNHDFHMFFQLLPRLSVWGGVELGTNIIVNVVSPEDAAEFYRT